MRSPDPIRLLVIGPLPPEAGGLTTGGIATHVWELARQAAQHGNQVTVLEDTIPASVTVEGIRVIRFPATPVWLKGLIGVWLLLRHRIDRSLRDLPDFLPFTEQIKVAYYLRFLSQVVRETRPEVIHLHNEHSKVAVALAFLRPSVPYIFMDHAFWQTTKTEFLRDKVRWIVRHATVFTYTSDYCVREHDSFGLDFRLRKKLLYPVLPEKFTHLRTRVTKEKRPRSSGPRILFVGVWEAIERKGLDTLLDAFVNMPLGKRGTLTVVTSESAATECRRRWGKDGKVPDVDFLPPKGPAELSALFRSSDVFVLPSRSESFGIVYIEALLHGTPVIGFHPIIQELTKLLGGYVGEPFDHGKETSVHLAKKLIAVSRKRVSRDRLQKRALEVFAWDIRWKEFEALYRSIVAGLKNPRA